MIEKITEVKNWFFENIKETEKPPARPLQDTRKHQLLISGVKKLHNYKFHRR